jgi:hypothetical protein
MTPSDTSRRAVNFSSVKNKANDLYDYHVVDVHESNNTLDLNFSDSSSTNVTISDNIRAHSYMHPRALPFC